MKIHEYQAKELLAEYGVATQTGRVAFSKQEAVDAAKELGFSAFVVKAQVHSGGRGKAGGVKLAKSPEEVGEIAEKMIGMRLITNQTGKDGRIVRKVLITNAVDIQKEYYLSITMGGDGQPAIIASAAGGTEIEETFKKQPELILQQSIPSAVGIKNYHCLEMAGKMGLSKELTKEFTSMLKSMYRLFACKDCSLVEINPLVVTGEGRLLAIDGKINFDDNALFRHSDILALKDPFEEDEKEAEAESYGLNYVSLDGNIGCMVNGAGLAMATMDIIKSFGGSPANFLDVGGSATAERVSAAFKILLQGKGVRSILVNIFGGIMKCDVIAAGIVQAASEIGINVPLIVRLDGTNKEKGKQILRESGLEITAADDLRSAAIKSVEAAK
jgi:succinyl-CoA synthetase beta subunit